MHDNAVAPTPLLGAPLNVVVFGSQTFAEALEVQHTPVILVDLQLSESDDHSNMSE